MEIREIHLGKNFEKQFQNLSKEIKLKAIKAEQVFKKNAFHPSLRLHKLSGKLKSLWSISIDRKYRIIFMPRENGDILFISIGTHAIYYEG